MVNVALNKDGVSFETGIIDRTVGDDLIVHRVGVKVTAKTGLALAGHSTVAIGLDTSFKGKPLMLMGRVVEGKFLKAVPVDGTWNDAFGTSDVNIKDAAFTFEFDHKTLNNCPGPCGVKHIKVEGDTEVLLHAKDKQKPKTENFYNRVVQELGVGKIDTVHPMKSQLLVGQEHANTMLFQLANGDQVSQVKVAFPISHSALTKTMERAAKTMSAPVSMNGVTAGVLDTAAAKPFKVIMRAYTYRMC